MRGRGRGAVGAGRDQDGRGRRRLAFERHAFRRHERVLRRLRPNRAFDPGGGDQRRGPARWSATTPTTSRTHGADLLSPEEIGRLAGERAVASAGAVASRRPGAFPVLFDERVASSLIGHLVQAINGTAIARGASWLKDALGEQVLPAGLDLIEEPHRPRVAGSRPFDGEGLPTARRARGGGRRADRLDARSRDRPPARPAVHRQRRARDQRAAEPRRGQPHPHPGERAPATT